MRVHYWLNAVVVGLFIGGCAEMQAAPPPATKAAVAPTGKLRVAFLSGPLYATKDPSTGELKGVAVDLGKELARRVGVPFDPVIYPNPPALIAAAKPGEFDIALTGINAERARAMDFSAPYMEVEYGYLVRAGVPIATISDVDKAGTRIGVLEKSGGDLHLSSTLQNAAVVRVKSIAELSALFGAGKADVIAATKTTLFSEAERQPGSRVVDGRFLAEPIGMGVPKGRETAAAAYVGKFVEEAKAKGLIKSAIERAGLRGAVVAPLK
jgi:polar amino acid transport system substrate-binding protein